MLCQASRIWPGVHETGKFEYKLETQNSGTDYSSYLTITYLTPLQYSELQIWIRQGEVH